MSGSSPSPVRRGFGGIVMMPTDQPKPAARPAPAAAQDAEVVELKAVIKRIIFRSLEKNFFIVAASIKGRKGTGKLKMTLASPLEIGDTVIARGTWDEYQGEPSFNAITASIVVPREASGVSKWLKKGVNGVGPRTIELLIAHFGSGLVSAVESVPVLLTCPGITNKVANLIVDSWTSNQNHNEWMTTLLGYGLNSSQAKTTLETFGSSFADILRDDPWELASLPGIAFHTADAVAMQCGFSMTSEKRIIAGLRWVLNEAVQSSGDTCISRDALVTEGVLRLDVDTDDILPVMERFLASPRIVLDETTDLIYPRKLYEDEVDIATTIADLLSEDGAIIDEEQATHAVRLAERTLGVELDDGQFAAAVMAVRYPVCIITGGPGTGKSTTQRVVFSAIQQFELTISAACPTGKAAKRLTEASGYPASTIHRQLGYSAETGGFLYGEPEEDDGGGAHWDDEEQAEHEGVERPIRKLPFDQIVVDEHSMTDTSLAAAQLRAIRKGGRILMVGDVDQLPSVGPGQVLRDLIDSGVIPVARLLNPHRTARDSGIAVAANDIKNGRSPIANGLSSRGFEMRPRTGQGIMREVLTILKNDVPAMGLSPTDDVLVLAAMKDVDNGVKQLNNRIKSLLNPESDSVESHDVGDRTFSVGDTVMQMKNEAKTGVMNGETGVITGFKVQTRKGGKHFVETVIDFDGLEVVRAPDGMAHVEHAFAGTIHKSQGSEKPVVIMVLPRGHSRMLTKKLVYTGLTRGKVQVFIVGEESTLEAAIQRSDDQRCTGLQRRLRERLMPPTQAETLRFA